MNPTQTEASGLMETIPQVQTASGVQRPRATHLVTSESTTELMAALFSETFKKNYS